MELDQFMSALCKSAYFSLLSISTEYFSFIRSFFIHQIFLEQLYETNFVPGPGIKVSLLLYSLYSSKERHNKQMPVKLFTLPESFSFLPCCISISKYFYVKKITFLNLDCPNIFLPFINF